MVDKPTLQKLKNGYRFSWPEYQIQICVSRIRESKDGGVKGEIEVALYKKDEPHSPHIAQYNFLSSNARGQLAERLQNWYPLPHGEWSEMLELLTYNFLHHYRKGEPVVHISTTDEIKPPEYLINPILPLNQPTVIFGDGGVGKSYLALSMSICALLPWRENNLGLGVPERSVKGLYLDWEADRDVLAWRLKCLEKGLQLPYLGLDYLRCSSVFADDIEHIQDKLDETGAEFIVIDSLAGACGGDLSASEPATRFCNALRTLNVTSLIVAHNSKGEGKKTIYGSAIFEHRARSVWECKAVRESSEGELAIGLFHRKANNSKLCKPLGFKFGFDGGSTTITTNSIDDSSCFDGSPTIADRIQELLKCSSMSAREIIDKLGEKDTVVRSTLSQMKGKGLVTKDGDKYGLSG